MAKSIDVFLLVPEIAAIGQERLQRSCDEWRERPLAKQLGCADSIVGADRMLTVNIDLAVAQKVQSDQVFLPLNELLGYVIDRHFPDLNKRRELHGEVRRIRKLLAESGVEYQGMAGRSGQLWLKCKKPSCDVWMETAQRAIEGQTITCPPVSVTCPACGHTDYYDGSNLVLRLTGLG
jgi:hypothetical protein